MADAFLAASVVLIALCSVPLLGIYVVSCIPSRKLPKWLGGSGDDRDWGE